MGDPIDPKSDEKGEVDAETKLAFETHDEKLGVLGQFFYGYSLVHIIALTLITYVLFRRI